MTTCAVINLAIIVNAKDCVDCVGQYPPKPDGATYSGLVGNAHPTKNAFPLAAELIV
jgi:hypothetical protein